MRRAPNPNRNFPTYCPYCGGEELEPNEETDFAWKCNECLRVFEVKFHGQDAPDTPPAPARRGTPMRSAGPGRRSAR